MIEDVIPPQGVLEQITQRQEAKKAKNYELADQIQQEILSQGWVIQEKQGNTICKAKKRSNVRVVDNHRRQTTRKKQQYVRKKKTRFPIFAEFICEIFFDRNNSDDGIKTKIISEEFSIIDVAGGKG